MEKSHGEIMNKENDWDHVTAASMVKGPIKNVTREEITICTNQQPPQRGGAVPGPVWVAWKWLLAFPRVPVTPATPLHFFAMLPPERPQKGSTQLL